MGWHRKGRKREMREREERGYSLTTIPGATTATNIFEAVKAATNTQNCYCLTGLFYEDTCSTRILMIMIMTSGWGLQQRPTSSITKKIQYTKNKN